MLRLVLLLSLVLMLPSLATLPQGEHDSVIARQQRDGIQADHKARVPKAQRELGSETHMPCDYDLMCGLGDCWVGICLDSGFCRGMWTCV